MYKWSWSIEESPEGDWFAVELLNGRVNYAAYCDSQQDAAAKIGEWAMAYKVRENSSPHG